MTDHAHQCHCFRCRRTRSEYYTAPYTRWDYLQGAVRAVKSVWSLIFTSDDE